MWGVFYNEQLYSFLGLRAPSGGRNSLETFIVNFLSVTLLNNKDFERDIANKPFKPRNYFDIVE